MFSMYNVNTTGLLPEVSSALECGWSVRICDFLPMGFDGISVGTICSHVTVNGGDPPVPAIRVRVHVVHSPLIPAVGTQGDDRNWMGELFAIVGPRKRRHH